jgi:D-alanyl-lipoteichoic acid acyltransferase DltB (MBOAT superfamily)
VTQPSATAPPLAVKVASDASVHPWRAIVEFMPQLAQLALATVVVHLYSIEGQAFERLFVLTVVGFVINLLLPLDYRLRFFVGLSMAGAFLTFGPSDALWLIGVGIALIGLCHLPGPTYVSVAAILVAGMALAAARAGWYPVPWSASVWPILGSMFMFRLALYLHATAAGRQRAARGDMRGWSSLSYFFMLPNLTFPLFPVIDYQTWLRTYYDRDHRAIYEQGLAWIARGLVHLLLYRLVYQRFLTDPADVSGLGDLVQFMLSTFLLYLRVSGQFHLIVGILHLFGFRLPETHKLYYLAHSFTELWRRINIYWTDFMTKLVFYPTYFRVKRLGPTRALVVSTVIVFALTWLLHSYQWFWLRGGFPITPQDVLFWGVLGCLVVIGAVRESGGTGKSLRRAGTWSGRSALQAAATFVAFCFLWSLWSTESVGQWIWMVSTAATVDMKGVVLIGITVGIVAALGGREWASSPPAQSQWLRVTMSPSVRTAAVLAVLAVVGLPSVQAVAPPIMVEGLVALHATGLNARDTAIQHRGYYEQLDVRAAPTAVAADPGSARENWVEIIELDVIRERPDVMLLDLQPSRSVVWNGRPFSTNRWGMRDQEYDRDKRDDTFRIAILGPSHVMGDNVPDGETFESIVEARLNREFSLGRYRRFEVLNFAMPGYSILQQLAMLEDRVFEFTPDVVMLTHHTSNRELTERCLQSVIWKGVPVPYAPLQTMLDRAGLTGQTDGTVPVPFALLRQAARQAGVSARMPHGESSARVRRMSNLAVEWSLQRFASLTRDRGAIPVVLALNVVTDQESNAIPNRETLDALQLPVVDLSDVYPKDQLLSLRVAPWDDHPNADAHRLIAERLYPGLTRLLAALPVASDSDSY